MVVHSNRVELLRDLVITWIRRHPLSPLENEIALVQSNGIAQWLKLGFARPEREGGLGVSAAFQTMLPQRFVWWAYRQVLGDERLPQMAPFDAEVLSWRLMRLLPELLERQSFAALRNYLEDDTDQRKRYQLSCRLAALLQQYQLLRADWLEDWELNRDRISVGRQGRLPLPETQRWQAQLWRALIDDAPAGLSRSSRSATHARFLDAVRSSTSARPAAIPRRIILFGLSSLPVQSLEAIAALGHWSQVLLCVLNPCRHDWSETVADHDLLAFPRRRQQARRQPALNGTGPVHSTGHPLLAAWGRQGRDLIRLLDVHDDRQRYEAWFEAIGERIDLFESPDRSTLLGDLQADILDLVPRSEAIDRNTVIDPVHDVSIRFHICHSPQREVEVLHDQILAALAADPSLEPRDILVMVPEVSLYAPHVQAVFGRHAPGDNRHVPFSIADSDSGRPDRLRLAVDTLLSLPQSRLAAGEVLDLLEVPAIQRRFGIASDDLPRLRKWVDQAGIRWGFDDAHLAEMGVGTVNTRTTWRSGLDRLLLGYAGTDGQMWEGIAAVPASGAIEGSLIGALERFALRLDHARKLLGRPCSPGEWLVRLRELLENFFLPSDQDEGLALLKLQQTLQAWFEITEAASCSAPLTVQVVREHWFASLGSESVGRPFMGGGVTIATLTPMRAIPFRLIALLGMNDESYPRTQPPTDFDLIASDPRPGDRSRREDDRYLFLEAILSARDRLIVSWTGRSNTDDEARPPSVLVAQLRDHIDRCWRLKNGDRDNRRPSEALTVVHPLQPFSPRYFEADGDPQLFSYAVEWREALAARGRAAEQSASARPSDGRLGLSEAALPTTPLSLSDLHEFLRSPASHFLRGTLGIAFRRDAAPAADDECFVIDSLQLWQIRQTLLRAGQTADADGMARSESLADTLNLLAARGLLPAGGFETLAQADLLRDLTAIFKQWDIAQAKWPLRSPGSPIRFEFDRREGTAAGELVDNGPDLRADDTGNLARLMVLTGNVHGKSGKDVRLDRLLAPWVDHLATHVCGQAVTTVVIAPTGSIELPPLDPAEARAVLQAICEALVEGAQRPLPVAPRTAFAWLKAAQKGPQEQLSKARDAFEFDHPERNQFSERSRDPHVARCFADFDALIATREFDHWCAVLYAPLADAVGGREQTRSSAPEDSDGAPE